MTREAYKNDRVLQACDLKKFISAHYIHQSLYFDNAICSMLSFVFELQHFLRESLRSYVDAVDECQPSYIG
ncbi:hypothetical protein V1515DRAFT_578349 [Lipomyces mesembrius]